MSEQFLSSETLLNFEKTVLRPDRRWLSIPHTGIARPALVLAAGEIVTLPKNRIEVGEQLVLRYGAAHDRLKGGGVMLVVKLSTSSGVAELARLPIADDSTGLVPREILFDISPWAGQEAAIRLQVTNASKAPNAWLAIYDAAVSTPERHGLMHARAFRTERTENEIQHFSTVYDHAMYQIRPSEFREQSRQCIPLKDLVTSQCDTEIAAPMTIAHPLPADVLPSTSNPYEYAHHILGLNLQAPAPDFSTRLADMGQRRNATPDRPLKILSLCAGAARIESQFARNAGTPSHWTLLDISSDLLNRATHNFEGLPAPRLVLADVNEVEPFGEKFDIVVCISGLHHVVELERVISFIRDVLVDDGEFWSIGEAIGRRGNRLYEQDYLAANQLFQSLPARYRRNRASGLIDSDLPNVDYSEATFEGIRSDEIETVLSRYFEPVHVYRRNCFLWRMIDLAYTDNYDLQSMEDVNLIHRLVDAELAHFRAGGRPTELHGAYRRRLL